MKWVEIGGSHINTGLVLSFRGECGYLFLVFVDGKSATIKDPDRKLYIKLCHQLGVRPAEEVQIDGK